MSLTSLSFSANFVCKLPLAHLPYSKPLLLTYVITVAVSLCRVNYMYVEFYKDVYMRARACLSGARIPLSRLLVWMLY